METVAPAKEKERQPLTFRSTWTIYELMLFAGSSEEHKRRLHSFISVALDNFPKRLSNWLFTTPSLSEYSLEEVNNERRKGRFVDTPAVGLIDSYSIPAGCRIRVFLSDIKPGEDLPKYEFCLVREKLDKKGIERKVEVTSEGEINRLAFHDDEEYQEVNKHFRLEPVPGHPGRRYLILVRT